MKIFKIGLNQRIFFLHFSFYSRKSKFYTTVMVNLESNLSTTFYELEFKYKTYQLP